MSADTGSGVSAGVQYDTDLLCDQGHEPRTMLPTEHVSDQGNTIYECPECPCRRAVSTHVVPVSGGGA